MNGSKAVDQTFSCISMQTKMELFSIFILFICRQQRSWKIRNNFPFRSKKKIKYGRFYRLWAEIDLFAVLTRSWDLAWSLMCLHLFSSNLRFLDYVLFVNDELRGAQIWFLFEILPHCLISEIRWPLMFHKIFRFKKIFSKQNRKGSFKETQKRLENVIGYNAVCNILKIISKWK